MSQQIINISTPDDGLGDVLRNGFDKTNQNFTELYNGKVDKITGQGLSENNFTDSDKSKLDGIESGAEVNVQADWGETDPLSDSFIQNKPPALYSAFGYFHVSDLATQTTPLELVSSTPLQLTNDNAGAFTSEAHAPYGVPKIWNTSTNSLDFTHLSVGDAVLVRTDLSISTSSVNQNLQLYIKFGIGTPSEYDLLIDSWNEKSVVNFKIFLKDVSFSIDNEDWRTAPAKIYILSDDDGKVKVNGWYIPIIRKSVNIIDIQGGTQFKKKSESAAYNDPTLSGTDAVISLQPNGQGVYAFSNAGLTSIDGFGLDLITGNPSAETPYPNKDILIYNNKATDLILKHDGSGTADVKFLLEGGVDLVIPAGGKVWLKYGLSYCELIFKSWNEVDLSTKQDKLTETNFGQFMDVDLATKVTPSVNDTFVGRDSLTNEAVEIPFSTLQPTLGYTPLPTTAGTASGATLSFVTDRVYGTITSPITGNITADLTGAQLGVTNIIIHNSGTAPNFSSEFKKLSGSGNYVVGVVNYIYCTFITSTEIIYSINQRT
jgi:hypothetical protein